MERRVWLDATGVMRWGAQPPTGIQRVEQTICKAAMHGNSAGFVTLDGVTGRYTPLSRREHAFFAYILSGRWPAETDGYWRRLAEAVRFLDVQFKHQDNETSRRLAQMVIGGRPRRGPLYRAVKTGVRIAQWAYFSGRLFWGWSHELWTRFAGDPVVPWPRGSVVLVSHEVNRHWQLDRALKRSGLRAAHIVHDLIPVLQPEFASPRFRAGMEGFLRRVLTKPEPVIAVSQATKADLQLWNRTVVKAPYPYEIKVSPLGSALVATELDDEAVQSLSGRPFALYCSTFEKRKNHPFLVSVWAWLARNVEDSLLPDLVLVGRSGKTTGEVEAIIAATPELVGRVHIMSGVSDKQLRWLYRNARLGVFPSSAEGWGLGVSECMAYGLPTVHSDIPALGEAAQNLMPALPVLDFEAWTEGLRDVLETPGRLEKLRRTVAEKYDKGSAGGFGVTVLEHLQELAEQGTETARAASAPGLEDGVQAAPYPIATSPSSLT